MIHNKYSILIIVTMLLFNGCKTDRSETVEDIPMVCQKLSTKSFHNKSYLNAIKIKTPTPLNILVSTTTTPPKEVVKFDNEGLYRLFQTKYFWAKETVKNFDVRAYTHPQELIDAIRYKEDRWSFAITPKKYNSIVSQKSVGLGFLCQDTQQGCLVTYVRIDSPADNIDLRRGDIIEKINNQKATEELIYATSQEEKELALKILRSNSNESCSGKVLPRDYRYNVVSDKILKTSNHAKVGYLRLDSFLGTDRILAQIDGAFDNFKRESIQKLIIDLRYNGGGSVELASQLLNRLTLNREDDVQFTLAWNREYQNNNQTYRFKSASNALDLKQILFLTTRDSASASELIISAMKAYLPEDDVVIIGERTHGKPVGMQPESDGSYYYFLINFVVQNALGFYDYFDGFPVTVGCNVKDDPFHEMGDPNESMLKTALHYAERGSCQ